jgi:quercetin dioxygenase-like cupin family protein
MDDRRQTAANAYVGSVSRMAWQEFPGHFRGALSKELIGERLVGTRRLDFRISHYQPMAWVEEHTHERQEQIYFVLEGEGSLTLDSETHILHRHEYAWIPPGVRHSFVCSGLTPLVFLVLTSPSSDSDT